jgi:peptide/nickel transport system substrate-binding protein
VLCACTGDERPATTTQTATVEDDKPRDGGTLIRRLETDIVSLNPIIATTKYDRHVDNYIFTPLLYLDKNLRPIAGIAESWEISDDGLRYTFRLNPKATFSDGKPVRAQDVLFTLSKTLDPHSDAVQLAGHFDLIDLAKSRAVDANTVELAFREPLAAQLVRFGELNILPEHVYSQGDFAKDFNEKPVGSGAYRLVKFDPGTEIILERRDDYWGERPHIKTIVFKVISDFATASNALKRGDIDETLLQSDAWARDRNDATLKRTIDYQRFYTRQYNYVGWNNKHPLFADKRVRRALALCTPIESIINDLFHGTARAMSGPFVPDEWAYNPTVPVLRYDPNEAKRILTSIGWLDRNGDGVVEKDGRPFRFSLIVLSRTGTGMQFAQLLQSELKKIGVQMEISVMEGASGLQRVLGGNYEAAYLAWDLDADPDVYALFHSSQTPPRGQNFVFYSNKEADRLMEAGRRELDQSKRTEIYHQLHALLADEQPYLWVLQVSSKWGVNRRVRGIELSPALGPYMWYPGEFSWWLAK